MRSHAEEPEESESEPWEALDVDDSELSSFLHPCKRKSPPPTANNRKKPVHGNPNNLSILQRCSLRSSQTLTPSPETSALRTIPGPAGAVQAAMLRKVHKDPSSFGVEGEPIPTQEYIRRAFEEPGGNDDDFSRAPWLSAVDFVRTDGLVGDDGIAIGTPLSVIKGKFGTVAKVNQVVAIVKSCTPNGLGDLMVTLKDPTGSLDASIHRKVIAESEFGRDIRVGAVLILQKVAIFAPSRSSCYLNITFNNLVKVITKDTLLSLEQHASATTENNKGMWMQASTLAVGQGRTEGIMKNLRQEAYVTVGANSDIEIEEGNTSAGSRQLHDVIENKTDVGSKQPISKKQDLNDRTASATSDDQKNMNAGLEKYEDVAVDLSTNDGQEVLLNEHVSPLTKPYRSNQSDGFRQRNAVIASVEGGSDEETANSSIGKTHAVASKSSLPQWTDEQLDELFDFD